MIGEVVAPRNPARVAACVAAHRGKRLTSSLTGVADVEFHETFDAMLAAMSPEEESVVVLAARDARGSAAAHAIPVIESRLARCPVILYVAAEELGGALASAGVADLILADETDRPEVIRSVVIGAIQRISADRVVSALKQRLSGAVAVFAETAVRYPSCTTVEAVADHLGVHRQTPPTWCRNHSHLRAEELLVWSRLLLVSAMLEQTERSVASLAVDFDFPSTVALRNQLKRYTGFTAQEIRAEGLKAVLTVFDDEIRGAGGRRSVMSSASAG